MKTVLALLFAMTTLIYAEGVAPEQEDAWLREKDAEYRAKLPTPLRPVPDPIASPPRGPTELAPEILANYDYVNAHKKDWREAEADFKVKYQKWWHGDICGPELFAVADRCSIGFLDRLPKEMVTAMKEKGWEAHQVGLDPLPNEIGKPYCNDMECAFCLKTDPKHIKKILDRLAVRTSFKTVKPRRLKLQEQREEPQPAPKWRPRKRPVALA